MDPTSNGGWERSAALALLGLESDADTARIRAAYWQFVLEHDEKDPTEVERMFARERAFAFLSETSGELAPRTPRNGRSGAGSPLPPPGDEVTVHVLGDVEGLLPGLIRTVASLGLPVADHASPGDLLDDERLSDGDCVLSDVRLRGSSGLHLLHELRQLRRDVAVVFLTANEEVPVAVEAIKRGAADYLTPPFSAQLVLRRIHEVLERRSRGPALPVDLTERFERFEALTDRERQILDRIVAGRSSKQVAFELSLSKRTVDAHRSRIMKKLDAHSLAELVRLTVLRQLDEERSAPR